MYEICLELRCMPWVVCESLEQISELFHHAGRSFQSAAPLSAQLRSAVSVSAPEAETAPTWLPTCDSQRGVRSPCQWSLCSACRAIRFVQLRNSFLKVLFPSIWRTSSKYSTKQHIYAKLSAKQMSKIWWKNIHAFMRYNDFGIGAFYFAFSKLRYTFITERQKQQAEFWLKMCNKKLISQRKACKI